MSTPERIEGYVTHGELLETFVEQSSDGIVVIDECGRIVEWNPTHERLTGVSRATALGALAWDVQAGLVPPERRTPGQVERFKATFLEALRTGQSPVFEKPLDVAILGAGGETRFVQQRIFPIRTAIGYRLGTITRDLTSLRQAREEIVEQARQLKALGELAIELAEVSPDADFHAVVAGRLREITGALGVGVTTYDQSSSCLIVRSVAADEGLLDRASEILGGNPVGMRIPLTSEVRQRLIGVRVRQMTSLTELTFGAISESAGRLLVSALRLGESVGCCLRYADSPVGSIFITMPRDRPSLAEPMVEALARVVTVALRRHHAEREKLRLNRALRTISECNQTLVRATDESQLVEAVCRIVVEIGGYRLAWIGHVQAGESDAILIRPVAHHGHDDGFLQAFSRFLRGGSGQAFPSAEKLLAGQPAIIRDIASDDSYAPWRAPALARGYRSAIIFPLMGENEPIGVLAMYDGEPNGFETDEVALFAELAGDVAYGLRTLRLREAHRRTAEIIRRTNADLAQAYDSTLEGWSRALELRERETAGHSQRVVELTTRIAREMGLAESEIVHIRRGALLHDIGKMGVPDSILLKPEPLDGAEWQVMRRHPELARGLLANIAYLDRAIEIPYCHHERWDGSGYPNRLRGEEIPLAARIFAVVDVWDALTCDRPYRRAWSEARAAQYLTAEAGKHFDPAVVTVFLRLWDRT